MAQSSFKRDEIKYLLTAEQKKQLLFNISPHLFYDKYCSNGLPYMVKNIYFDTPSDLIIRKSITKPRYKAKLRLRQYGYEDCYYLELKKKVSGIVYKRRIPLNSEEKDIFLRSKAIPIPRDYISEIISREIAYFLNLYPEVSPTVAILYNRIALCGPDDLRLTIDSDIVADRHRIELDTDAGESILESGLSLLEIKIAGAIPLWLVKVLSQYKIYPISFSKYGKEYKNYLKKERQNVRVSV